MHIKVITSLARHDTDHAGLLKENYESTFLH